MRAGNLRALQTSYLKRLGADAHAVKDAFVPGAVARFNIAVGVEQRVYLVPVKAGSGPAIDTGLTLSDLPKLFPLRR